MRKPPAWILIAALIAACEIQEVTIAQPEHIVVAEVVLVAGQAVQTAWLHHTRVSDPEFDPRVSGAVITVRDRHGSMLRFQEAPDSVCYIRRRDSGDRVLGTCYASQPDPSFILPGQTYQLSIRTADDRTLTGTTTVPGVFDIVQPDGGRASIPGGTHYDVTWTGSENTWVYIIDGWFHGLRDALDPLPVPQDPLLLSGISISGSDTTVTVPREIGVFDRFENDLTPILARLQDGLPANVSVELTISAADRNYVNWVRAGTFNPNGQTRVPSIHGEGGTGVFGSVVQRHALIMTH